MGQRMSLRIFEAFNDVHITLGSGILGILILLCKGTGFQLTKTLILTSATAAGLRYFYPPVMKKKISSKSTIFITGCDSGLGFSLAQHACEMGFKVFAGCLNLNSEGAKELAVTCDEESLILIELDITDAETVQNAISYMEHYLKSDKENELYALVNNAGVMVFGEFEWQTEHLMEQQIEVNLLGTMRLTRSFLPLLRKYNGRIININSHCASETLPGLSVYGASKAALLAWSDGLRVELNKYGVEVTSFVPGSFIQHSNIMSQLGKQVREMQGAMSEEQMKFYGDYFKEYYKYLGSLSGVRHPQKIMDSYLYNVFERSLLETNPRRCYINEPWRYTLYHTLFKITPTNVRDYLVLKFVQMPEWTKKEETSVNITA